jgi:hypothetical protein
MNDKSAIHGVLLPKLEPLQAYCECCGGAGRLRISIFDQPVFTKRKLCVEDMIETCGVCKGTGRHNENAVSQESAFSLKISYFDKSTGEHLHTKKF